MTRRLDSWIDGFMDYTEGRSTQELFRLWTAIGTLSGALERKIWIMSQNRRVFPNMYIFLVGPPGSGKTYPIDLAHEIFDEALTEHHCAETTLSKQGLVDHFAEAKRIIHNPDMLYNALFVPSKELSMLIPEYDKEFISALTYFYDNIKYEEKLRNVRKGEPLIVETPCLTLLAGTTPAYMGYSIPVSAWDDGFLARVIIIYAEDEIIDGARPSLNLQEEEVVRDDALKDLLVADLKIIGEEMKGKIGWRPRAAKMFSEWYQTRCRWPVGGDIKESDTRLPTHPRLQHYCTRRHFHALKLCLISACDLGHEAIEEEDVKRVQHWMRDAELMMPGIFSAMESGGDANIIRDAYHFVQIEDARGGCPLTKLLAYLQMRQASGLVTRTYQNMLEGEILKAYIGPNKLTFVRAVPGAFGTIRTIPKKG